MAKCRRTRTTGPLCRWQGRFHDLSYDRFGTLIQALRERRPVRTIARELVEEGYCAHLSPRDLGRQTLNRFDESARR